MTELLFTKSEAWHGGSYDLAIKLSPSDDSRLRKSLEALWSSPELLGCYLRSDVEPDEQPRIAVAAVQPDTRLFGVARIGGRSPVPCSTIVVRANGEDWVFFYIPIGSLSTVFPMLAFPFADDDLAWRPALDEWLCAIGQRAFEACPFHLGLVGFDGGDFSDADRFEASGVPEERWVGYLVPDAGSLTWFAPNRGAPFDLRDAKTIAPVRP